MPKKIIWSPKSEEDFENILDYLSKEWDAEVTSKFIDLIDILLIQISINPSQFPLIHKAEHKEVCYFETQYTSLSQSKKSY